MFGGFGGFGGGGNNQDNNQQPGGFGFPGMTANVNVTHSSESSHKTSGGMHGMSSGTSFGSGQDDPSKKSQEMQDRYKYREEKLPSYTALVDVLELKGEDVTEMRKCIVGAKMTHEEMQKGFKVFDKVAAAMMSFDFAKIMQYSAELEELERIDNEKERQFRKLEMLLKGLDKYEEVRKEFNMVVHTTTTTPGHGASITMNVSGVPSAHITATGVPQPSPAQPTGTTLEERVAALEQENAMIKAEFQAFKAQQLLHNQTFDALIKTLQSQAQVAATTAQFGATSLGQHH